MTRILFVDDEPRVLTGLRQSLQRKRKTWELAFAESAAAALELMQRMTFDIVISDMRMPGVDGAELLTRVASLQPQASRFILSGQMDEDAATRAAAVAHRFLLKPCEPLILESVITRTLELAELLGSERIRNCVGAMGTLPSLPKACLALNEALRDDSTSVQAVVRIIESDIAMSSKVLQLVNSSFFGLGRRVSSVGQAVSYLGLKLIRNLAITECMFREFRGADVRTFEREQTRAQFCARIAGQLNVDKHWADVTSTAALLHDVGVVVLADRLPEEHRKNRELALTRRITLAEAEMERLGTTHAEIGAYLLGLWGLPHDVIDAVARHHTPVSESTELDVCTLVQLADSIAWKLDGCEDEPCLQSELPSLDRLQRWGIAERVRDIMAKTREKS